MPWKRNATAALAFLAVAATAHAESDAQVVEGALQRSARVCADHATDRTSPGVRAVRVDALRVLANRSVTLCPDRRLDSASPVVWYGHSRVLAWNPEDKAAVQVMAKQANAMANKDEYPTDTLVWDAKGEAVKNVTVPALKMPAFPLTRY